MGAERDQQHFLLLITVSAVGRKPSGFETTKPLPSSHST
jgi:hypothetical protein